ncbi:MAG: bifunctional phosphopantothenoylcysteine decarboxylase/phosphopantothenate--cysteine ligase CoaBC [Pseudomonadota bacterium]
MTHVLLGVTGGIAVYKSPDLTRRLIDYGASVQVVMTAGAQAFVTPLTFQAVSGRMVRTDLFDTEAEAAMGHIELARWADRVVIAPASADFIARFAAGMGDDLLTTVCLATEAPIYIAPAMNRQMWMSQAVQDNMKVLRERGVQVLGPGEGEQACGDTGSGRMLEPVEIAKSVLVPQDGPLGGKRVVITAGPTREPIDPVRYLTNRSSGKMGYALASAAREAGASVVLVSGPVAMSALEGVDRISVESAEEMQAAVDSVIEGADVFISAAAVADYRPVDCPDQKIKKTDETMTLELTRNPDILAGVAARDDRPFTVGFAAETQSVLENARGKMARKKLDMVIANQVGRNLAFDRDQNAATALWDGGERPFSQQSKQTLARGLIDCIAERYKASGSS